MCVTYGTQVRESFGNGNTKLFDGMVKMWLDEHCSCQSFDIRITVYNMIRQK